MKDAEQYNNLQIPDIKNSEVESAAEAYEVLAKEEILNAQIDIGEPSPVVQNWVEEFIDDKYAN